MSQQQRGGGLGEIAWYKGYGPSPVVGPCPHPDCRHHAKSAIAWGPSLQRYVLAQCDVPAHCDGGCRAWVDDRHRVASAWLQVEAVERLLSR
jgi:hypothetical protein